MKKKVVYLAMLGQLESLLREWRVVSVAIHRIEKREWIPFLDIENDAGQAYTCAFRVKKSLEPRTWSDLRALVDWLDTKVGVKECVLSFSDFEWESETLTLE
ncbi:KorA family transcriptional regulator [Paraburkholderia sp. SIMBA_049]